MFGREKKRTQALRAAAPYARRVARDEKLREHARRAAAAGGAAGSRLMAPRGAVGVATRLAQDEEARESLRTAYEELREARSRLKGGTSHRGRNLLLSGVLAGVALFNPRSGRQTREWLGRKLSELRGQSASLVSQNGTGAPSIVEESIEVGVPVSTAYNQWTQFEEFPRFMEGVESVKQLDDKRLHWVAQIGGRKNEWDAEITQQQPDQVIAWRATGGKQNAGEVRFESVGADRTRIDVHLTYEASGLVETLGGVVGADRRRVRGDLERFKELLEERGQESGAWRGEIAGGKVEQ